MTFKFKLLILFYLSDAKIKQYFDLCKQKPKKNTQKQEKKRIFNTFSRTYYNIVISQFAKSPLNHLQV